MTEITIDTATLKTVRKARKIARSKLAKLSGVTERQITRLETNAGAATLPHPAFMRLAAALDIPQPVLTGELALMEDDLVPASELNCESGCGCCG
ncbi:MAG: helix-turn-helix transcriptional regulator [Pseudomonadota bacterium]